MANGTQILVNGESGTSISVTDRGLAFGDGLFETVLVHGGRTVLLDAHLERLAEGAARLDIPLELSVVTSDIKKIFSLHSPRDAVLKVVYTRGPGGRGYRAPTLVPTRIVSLHPAPPSVPATGVRAFVCRQALAAQPVLAGIKHLNRLEQVLASREWPDDSFHEGVMLTAGGDVIEGTRSNLFISLDGRWCTPPLVQCGIAGVMRAHLLQRWGDRVDVAPVRLEDLLRATELCFCNSVTGIMPATLLRHSGGEITYTPGALCRAAHDAFQELLAA